MPYYPKSRIITGVKSNPGEFYLSNGKEYIGDYYITFDGKYFTGKSPIDGNSFPLTKSESPKEINQINIQTKDSQIFDRLNQGNIDIKGLLEPQPYYPKPTEDDYSKKSITRYFAKQRTVRKFKIIEINKETYDDIYNQRGVYNYPLWKVV